MVKRDDLIFWDDMLMLIAFLVSAVTGLLKFLLYPRGITLGIPPRVMNPIHDWAGVTLVLAAAVHLVLHWDWIVRTAKRKLGGKR